jgi:ABC-type phosphate transport system auxiliary subunit
MKPAIDLRADLNFARERQAHWEVEASNLQEALSTLRSQLATLEQEMRQFADEYNVAAVGPISIRRWADLLAALHKGTQP